MANALNTDDRQIERSIIKWTLDTAGSGATGSGGWLQLPTGQKVKSYSVIFSSDNAANDVRLEFGVDGPQMDGEYVVTAEKEAPTLENVYQFVNARLQGIVGSGSVVIKLIATP